MARIVITTDYLQPGDDLDVLLRERGHATRHSPARGPRPPGEMAALLRDADAALLAGERVTAADLDGAADLAVIARSGVGYESIDVAAASARGIYVCNTPGANRNAVAEMTVTLLLMCARRIGETLEGVRRDEWPRHDTVELRGRTLGVVGLGPSGRAVVELAHAFGMNIVVHTAYPDEELAARLGLTYASLAETLATADFVTLHTRPTAANTGLLDAHTLGLMKPTAYLVNTARGSLIDEAALAEALRKRTIAGAAVDVLSQEPLAQDSALRGLPNLVITSHLAGQTAQARAAASNAAAQEILRVLDGGRPTRAVNDPAFVRTGR